MLKFLWMQELIRITEMLKVLQCFQHAVRNVQCICAWSLIKEGAEVVQEILNNELVMAAKQDSS